MQNNSYSVLMSLYYKENPQHLREALDSIFSQTVPSDDVVLVEDGIVGNALDSVVCEYERLYCMSFAMNRTVGLVMRSMMALKNVVTKLLHVWTLMMLLNRIEWRDS